MKRIHLKFVCNIFCSSKTSKSLCDIYKCCKLVCSSFSMVNILQPWQMQNSEIWWENARRIDLSAFFCLTYSVLEPQRRSFFLWWILRVFFLVYLKLYINGSQFHIMYLLAPYLSHNVGKYLLKWLMVLIKYVFLPAAIKSIHKTVEGRFSGDRPWTGSMMLVYCGYVKFVIS